VLNDKVETETAETKRQLTEIVLRGMSARCEARSS